MQAQKQMGLKLIPEFWDLGHTQYVLGKATSINVLKIYSEEN